MKYQLYIVKEDHPSVKTELGSRNIELMRQQGHFGRRLTRHEVKRVKNSYTHGFMLKPAELNIRINADLIKGVPKYIFRFKPSDKLFIKALSLSRKLKSTAMWNLTSAHCDRLGGKRVDITHRIYTSLSKNLPPLYGEMADVLTECGLPSFSARVRLELIDRKRNPEYITWWSQLRIRKLFVRSKPAPIFYTFPGLEKTIPLHFNERVSYQD